MGEKRSDPAEAYFRVLKVLVIIVGTIIVGAVLLVTVPPVIRSYLSGLEHQLAGMPRQARNEMAHRWAENIWAVMLGVVAGWCCGALLSVPIIEILALPRPRTYQGRFWLLVVGFAVLIGVAYAGPGFVVLIMAGFSAGNWGSLFFTVLMLTAVAAIAAISLRSLFKRK